MAVKIVGSNSYANCLPFAPQAGVWFDGKYCAVVFMPGDGSTGTAPHIVYADDADLNFGTPHDIPSSAATTRGYSLGVWYRYLETYAIFGFYELMDGTGAMTGFYKSNNSLSASTEGFAGTPPALQNFPSIAFDANDYPWAAGTDNSTPPNIKIARATNAYDLTTWPALTTLHSCGAGNTGMPQIVGYSNGDIGAVYSDGSTLYYKHWTAATTSWGSEETITTDNASYYTFRGVVTRNQKLFVLWRSAATAANLAYRIRPQASGTWATAANAATDVNGAAGTINFTSMADVGKAESVYIAYYDGTNIAYITWNGSAISGKTTMVASPTLKASYLTSPFYDSKRFPVVYHTSDNNIRMEKIDLTPDEVGADGIVVSTDGAPHQGTYGASTQTVTSSDGDYTFVVYLGRDHQAWGNVYRHSTAAWLYTWTALGKRYWDAHNTINTFIDSSDNVYFALGHRVGANTTENIVVKKSNYALGNASFAMAEFTDISPAAVSGRGYKYIVVDDSGVVYLILGNTAGDQWDIREYRSGAWSAATTIIDINTGDANDLTYITAIHLGKEAVGQKSIHLFWTWRDASAQPQVTGGSILQIEQNYMKIVPQGDGTFKAYKADATEFTLPCATDNRDNVYDGSASEWVRVFGGVDVIGTSTPVVVFAKCSSSSPYAITGLHAYWWNGSAWTSSEIESSGFPWYIISRIEVTTSGIVVVSEKIISGVRQIVTYSSTDNGATWGTAQQKTTGIFDAAIPLISRKSDTAINLIWHERVSIAHSEVRLMSLATALCGFPILRQMRHRRANAL